MSRSSVLGRFVSSFGDGAARPVVAEALESRQLLASTVGGCVFEDLNKNGVQDAGEAGIAKVEITLTGKLAGGAALKLVARTNSKGRFHFNNLPRGKYTLVEEQPATHKDGKDRSALKRAHVGNDVIANIRLGGKDRKCKVSFGERVRPVKPVAPPGSISGHVYEDADDSGVKDAGEEGIAGVRVELTGITNDGQAVQRVAHTDAEGAYQFLGLKAGTYTVVAEQAEGFVDGIEAAGSLGGVVADDALSEIVLGAGEDGVEYNFGELRAGSISGKVFIDLDGDGVMEEGEAGVPDVLITLTGTDDIGEAVAISTRTNESGVYEFTELRPGTYEIAETQPFGLEDGGSIVGSAGGVGGVNAFSEIVIGVGVDASGYDFSEAFHDDETPPPGGTDGGSDGECDYEWDEWRGKWRRLLEVLKCR